MRLLKSVNSVDLFTHALSCSVMSLAGSTVPISVAYTHNDGDPKSSREFSEIGPRITSLGMQ